MLVLQSRSVRHSSYRVEKFRRVSSKLLSFAGERSRRLRRCAMSYQARESLCRSPRDGSALHRCFDPRRSMRRKIRVDSRNVCARPTFNSFAEEIRKTLNQSHVTEASRRIYRVKYIITFILFIIICIYNNKIIITDTV